VRIFGSFLPMPEHVWSAVDNPATFAFAEPIGTGPYTLTSAASNRTIWDRNDDWWGAASGFMDLPAPQRVIFLESGGEESRAQLLAQNQIDIGHSVSLGTFEAIGFQNRNVISWESSLPYAWPDPCARQMEFNSTVEPWNDPNMRKAVSMLIDRTQIVNIAYEGTTSPSRSMFVQYGGMEPFISAIEAAGYGVAPTAQTDEAIALIEAAGWAKGADGIYEKDGVDLTANIHVNSASAEYTRTIDVVVEQLNRAGIAARAVPVENSVFWGEVLPLGNYEMSYSAGCPVVRSTSRGRRWGATPTTPSLRSVSGRRASTTPGAGTPTPRPAYTAIVNEMQNMQPGQDGLVEMVVEAYQYLDAEVPFTPLVQAAKLIPMNTTYWTGWPTAENNYNHPAFWWGSAHHIIHNLERAEGQNQGGTLKAPRLSCTARHMNGPCTRGRGGQPGRRAVRRPSPRRTSTVQQGEKDHGGYSRILPDQPRRHAVAHRLHRRNADLVHPAPVAC
jgi:peptide/nickel transport system substrate-binding protein